MNCTTCGRPMRTSGIKGRCIECHEVAPVRCSRCARVRHGAGKDWFDHPARFTVEVVGLCARCGEEQHDEAEQEFWREFRAAQKRKATGQARGKVADPFDGFRS